MKHGFRLTALIVLVWSTVLSASVHETLPIWHWAYNYIDELQLRGYFHELYASNRPYTRGEVARSLISIEEQLKSKLVLSSTNLKFIRLLKKEFRVEIAELSNEVLEVEELKLGGRIRADINNPADRKTKYKGIYRSKISVPLGRHVTVYNGFNFDQYTVDDSTFTGKTWNPGFTEFVMYTEQAYITIDLGRFRIKCGRDFLRWGTGYSGTLLFSEMTRTRTLDQLMFSARKGPFLFSFFIAPLEDMSLDSVWTAREGGNQAKRWLSGHRLNVLLFRRRLELAISEVTLYGGRDRQVNFIYSNPFLPYMIANWNRSGTKVRTNLGRVNFLISTDLICYPLPGWKLYGSFLLDQNIFIKARNSDELEPPQYGLIIGSCWGDPIGLHGLKLSAEYVRVTNRTYKTETPYETFSFKNVTMGHPLGNDFEHCLLGVSKWFGGNLWFRLGYSYTRKGEGSMFTPWDAPWKYIPVEERYSEPFPTGIVENRRQWDFELSYVPSVHWGINAEFHSWSLDNADHVLGERRQDTSWRIGAWLDGDVILKLGG